MVRQARTVEVMDVWSAGGRHGRGPAHGPQVGEHQHSETSGAEASSRHHRLAGRAGPRRSGRHPPRQASERAAAAELVGAPRGPWATVLSPPASHRPRRGPPRRGSGRRSRPGLRCRASSPIIGGACSTPTPSPDRSPTPSSRRPRPTPSRTRSVWPPSTATTSRPISSRSVSARSERRSPRCGPEIAALDTRLSTQIAEVRTGNCRPRHAALNADRGGANRDRHP